MKESSIVLTVFNKEFLIEQVLQEILSKSSTFVRELIIVFDSCVDRSEDIVKRFLARDRKHSILYEYIDQGFEIKSNNLGLKKARCPYSIIFQDDMVINEKEYDLRLLKPFMKWDDVFAVTAQTSHNNVVAEDGRLEYTNHFDKVHNSPRNVFGIRDVANRGPLMLDNNRLCQLGYLDESFCPQTYDDHDLCYKAYKRYRWVCGSYWTDRISEPAWGATRNTKGGWHREALLRGESIIKERYKDLLLSENKHDENRILE